MSLMNDPVLKTLEHGVDWIRGSRDHVLATDLLAVAPIPPESQKLEFFFQSATSCPGKWLPSERSKGLEDHQQVVASVTTFDSLGTHKWCFVVDTRSPIATRLIDSAEESIMSSMGMEDGQAAVVMTNTYTIWEYIIWTTKSLGLVLFPGVQWYIAYLKVDLGRLPKEIAGHKMSLYLHRTRLTIREVLFSVDGTIAGSVGARERNHSIK